MKLQDWFRNLYVRKALSLAAILLLVSLGPIQVFHHHAGAAGQSEDTHCALCQGAHAIPSLILVVAISILVLRRAFTVLYEPVLRSSEFHPHLFSRPPPSIA
jgi:hypothetical protein